MARRLGTCHSVVCASPAYLARHPTPQQVQDLALHNCLTYTYFGKSLWEFQGPAGPESVPVSGNLSANISNLLLEATLGGAGISMQPCYSAQPYLESGALVPLLSQWQPKRLRRLRRVWYPQTDVSPAAQLPRFSGGQDGSRPHVAGVKRRHAKGAHRPLVTLYPGQL